MCVPKKCKQKTTNYIKKKEIKSQKQNSIANDAHFCIPDFQNKKKTGLS